MSSTEQDLRDLLSDRSAAAPAAPERLTHVQRRVRRQKRRELAMAAAAMGLVAVAVIVLAGGGLRRAGPLPPSHPTPSPTSTTFALSPDPFLTNADLNGMFWGGIAQDRHAAAPRLSPCLPDPRGWGAAQSEVATYPSHTDPTVWLNEFVLRFADPAAAHRAVLAAWSRLRTCSHNDALTPPGPLVRGESRVPLDDIAFGQGGIPSARPAVYVPRIARWGNVVLVIEDTGIADDRSWAILALGMYRASPQYRAAHPVPECFSGPVCPTASP